MEARTLRRPGYALIPGLLIALQTVAVNADGYRLTRDGVATPNFLVTADDRDVARQVGEAAEEYRRQLAIFWLGEPLPNWSRPCRLRVRAGALGASGQTTFQFVRGEVINWNMYVQGSLERILDSVLPHEVNHTIFACHFRRPLPRWADEGAATLFEHHSEQAKQLALLKQVVPRDGEAFSLRQLLTMKEYPSGMRRMLILYSQGYALADFLVQQKGRHTYLQFLEDGERMGWERAIRKHFDHDGIEALEQNWKGWVLAGMPKLTVPKDQMLAATESGQSTARPDLQVAGSDIRPIVRSQSPDSDRDHGPRYFGKAAPQPEAADAGRDLADSRWMQAPREPDRRPGAGRHAGLRSSEQRSPQQTSQRTRTSGGASTEAARTPRRQTIEAPLPRVRSGAARSSSAEASRSRPDNSGDNRSLDAGFFRSSDRTVREGLEPTASSSPGTGRSAAVSDPFSAERPEPRKRIVESGTVPQWAGFPGRSKSF